VTRTIVTRLPGTFGNVSDEIGTEIPIGRATSAGVTAAAQSGSNRKESSSPIGEPGSQARAARTAPESPKRLNTVTSGWMNLRYAAPVIKLAFITPHTATETVDIILLEPLYFFAPNISEVAAAYERVLRSSGRTS